jgi:hypothetical protein
LAKQFYIELSGEKEPKFRRELVVKENITFHDFHNIIKMSMGCENHHMVQISPKGYNSFPSLELKTSYPLSELSAISYLIKGYELSYDAGKAKLREYFNSKGQKITYVHDFGEDWFYAVTLKIFWPGDRPEYLLLAGRVKCPLEDFGGIWGNKNFLCTINNLNNYKCEYLREWLGLEEG